MMEPLRVVLTLAAPIVDHGSPIHLDALLAYVKVRHVPGAGQELGGREPEQTVSLPLARAAHGGRWWYQASGVALGMDGVARSQTSWSKRFDREHEHAAALGGASQVTLKLGRFKDCHVPLDLAFTPTLEFHCIGDYQGVRRLAKRIEYVGAKASQGYGRVSDVSVERTDLADRWEAADGRQARNMPADYCLSRGLRFEATSSAPVTPPYWRVSERLVCRVAVWW